MVCFTTWYHGWKTGIWVLQDEGDGMVSERPSWFAGGQNQHIHPLSGHWEMDWKPSSGFTLLCRSNETQLRCMTCPSSFMDAQEASVSYQLCFQEVLVVSFLLPTVCLGTRETTRAAVTVESLKKEFLDKP